MSLARPSFDLDLARGQVTEGLVEGLLTDRVKVEVKDQSRARTHVFIELEDAGRPSGLNVTTADYWAIRLARSIVMIATDELRALVRKGAIARGLSRGGDNFEAVGVALPISWLVGQ